MPTTTTISTTSTTTTLSSLKSLLSPSITTTNNNSTSNNNPSTFATAALSSPVLPSGLSSVSTTTTTTITPSSTNTFCFSSFLSLDRCSPSLENSTLLQIKSRQPLDCTVKAVGAETPTCPCSSSSCYYLPSRRAVITANQPITTPVTVEPESTLGSTSLLSLSCITTTPSSTATIDTTMTTPVAAAKTTGTTTTTTTMNNTTTWGSRRVRLVAVKPSLAQAPPKKSAGMASREAVLHPLVNGSTDSQVLPLLPSPPSSEAKDTATVNAVVPIRQPPVSAPAVMRRHRSASEAVTPADISTQLQLKNAPLAVRPLAAMGFNSHSSSSSSSSSSSIFGREHSSKHSNGNTLNHSSPVDHRLNVQHRHPRHLI
ncbi:hypothetical protein BDF19DRAFT_315202 [Syncephalis fuscata]|nr:hypothetical protein BDF19DRAFT_315202 [Syncephalis fuscata]